MSLREEKARGNSIMESKHEITLEIDRLIGPRAQKNSLMRLNQLERLQQTLKCVRRMSNKMTADRYFKVMERMEQMLKEIA